MSKMPSDRNADWQQIFDRFGSLDGGLRRKLTSETARPVSETDSDDRNKGPVGRISQPTTKVRRAAK